MTTQNEMLKEISEARVSTDRLMAKNPADHRLRIVHRELERLAALVKSSWPLQDKDKGDIFIGVYAIREIEDTEPDLALLLTHIAYDLKHT